MFRAVDIRVQLRDCRFHVIRRQLIAGGGQLQLPPAFGDESRIPERAVLIDEQDEIPGRIHAARKARGQKVEECDERVRRRRRRQTILQ